jgi:hypothetical protein
VRFVVDEMALLFFFFFSEYFSFSCQQHSNNAPYSSSSIQLLLPEGQTGETWKPLKMQRPFGNSGALDVKAFSLLFRP